MLEDAGLVENKEGRLELTPTGIRRLGQNALAELFKKLSKDMMGGHQVDRLGVGHERTYDTKPYEWGDPFNLQIERTHPQRGPAPLGATASPVARSACRPTTSRSSRPSRRFARRPC